MKAHYKIKRGIDGRWEVWCRIPATDHLVCIYTDKAAAKDHVKRFGHWLDPDKKPPPKPVHKRIE